MFEAWSRRPGIIYRGLKLSALKRRDKDMRDRLAKGMEELLRSKGGI